MIEYGTLCKLIPLDVMWEGKCVKFRVEVGDLGVSIGTVMKHPPDTEFFEAHYISPDDPYNSESCGKFPHPEYAALTLAIEHVNRTKALVTA